jgi:hypothetical protein
VINDPSSLIVALSNFGGLGIVIAFLVYRDAREGAAKLKLEREHFAEKLLMEERRLAFDRERLEGDRALAASLAALTGAIQSRGVK